LTSTAGDGYPPTHHHHHHHHHHHCAATNFPTADQYLTAHGTAPCGNRTCLVCGALSVVAQAVATPTTATDADETSRNPCPQHTCITTPVPVAAQRCCHAVTPHETSKASAGSLGPSAFALPETRQLQFRAAVATPPGRRPTSRGQEWQWCHVATSTWRRARQARAAGSCTCRPPTRVPNHVHGGTTGHMVGKTMC
jgi:hypothetical protein